MSDTFSRLAAEEVRTASALDAALRPLRSTVSFMQTGAHPDDETSGLLALLGRVHGLRLSYACATRGEGGQNALGAERADDLAMIRVREMELAAHSLSCRLYWLSEALGDRIRDWRFSKSGEETLDVWGRERTLERMVRILREEQPDIVCPTFLDVGGQHGHHRAMTRIAREAFDIAGDPSAYPQHLTHGLAPWQAAKFYLPAWSGAGDSYDDSEPPPPVTLHFDIGAIEPATGVPYVRIGEWSRRFHATQGMGKWIEAGTMPRPLHLAASRVGSDAGRAITDGIPADLAEWADAEPALAIPLRAAHAAISEALANSVIPGLLRQHLATARKHITSALDISTSRTEPPGLLRVLRNKVQDIGVASAVAIDERALSTAAAVPLPHRHGAIDISLGSTDILINRTQPPQQHALLLGTSSKIAAERFAIEVVPGLAVRVEATRAPAPPTIVIPAQAGTQADRQPADPHLGSRLRGNDETMHQLHMTLDFDPAVATDRIETDILLDGAPLQAISRAHYPHTGTVTRTYPARVCVQVVDAHIAPGMRVAYVSGGFDRIDHWLSAIGIETVALDEPQFANADLGTYSTIVIGILAFGARPDLAPSTQKLRAFVRAGGHLVTFYHRPADAWRHVPLAPITIGLPSVRWRTTRADSPVTHLQPEHTLLTTPNVITAADWSGWVKERGLYFASTWDAAYEPLLAMSDPGEAPLLGALLSGRFGSGRHTHCALALHTQLDALVPGAFRLLANFVQPAR